MVEVPQQAPTASVITVLLFVMTDWIGRKKCRKWLVGRMRSKLAKRLPPNGVGPQFEAYSSAQVWLARHCRECGLCERADERRFMPPPTI